MSAAPVRKCVECGCTDDRACPGGCSWASLDPLVCTVCMPKALAELAERREALKWLASADRVEVISAADQRSVPVPYVWHDGRWSGHAMTLLEAIARWKRDDALAYDSPIYFGSVRLYHVEHDGAWFAFAARDANGAGKRFMAYEQDPFGAVVDFSEIHVTEYPPDRVFHVSGDDPHRDMPDGGVFDKLTGECVATAAMYAEKYESDGGAALPLFGSEF